MLLYDRIHHMYAEMCQPPQQVQMKKLRKFKFYPATRKSENLPWKDIFFVEMTIKNELKASEA